MKYACIYVTSAVFALCLHALAEVRIPVDGTWNVKGEGFAGVATVPGTLAEARLGKRWTENDFTTTMDFQQSQALVQEWQYVGRAEWTRTVELTAGDCRRQLEIFLERVMWQSEAYWDGQRLGSCDSLATPHVYALPSKLATPGRHELKIVVDNTKRYKFSRQSHAYGPTMQAVWNGMLGRVELRQAHPLRQVRVFAAAPANKTLRVEVPAGFEVRAKGAVRVEDLDVVSVSERPSPYRAGWTMLELSLKSEPVYWNEFHPQLYTLVLTDARAGFVHRIRFGFRTPGVKGNHLTLNGVPFFMRGNVENANMAKDGLPWMDVAEWKRVWRVLKEEDGVNAVRFHTWCPPQAAFTAADEVGLLLLPEAGIWTDRWMVTADEVGNGKPVDAFAQSEMKAIADTYGNSPSFFSLSIGNELGTSNFKTMEQWVAAHKQYDPRALCYACSARTLTAADDFSLSHIVPGKGLAREKLCPHTDWGYEEIYRTASIPTVAHEIGQWPVYPLWDGLLAPFTGSMRPWNLSRYRDLAVKKGTARFQREYHEASAQLNRLLYKEEVESFLRTPSCAGLQLLSVQDYTGQAEALIGWRDPFYALKPGFATESPFSSVWGPVCALARFGRFTYTVGESFQAALLVRNLTDKPILAGTRYEYVLCGKAGHVSVPESVEPGEVKCIGNVACELDAGMAMSRQKLSFGGNVWHFWVYPREERCQLPPSVVACSTLDEVKPALAAGKSVLFTGRSSRSAPGRFKPVYWSAHWFPVADTLSAALGTWFDARHPAFAGFMTGNFTDWQWYTLSEGAEIHLLQDMPQSFRPIALSVNDFHFCDFASPLFEVLVGKGRLLVCGYDLEADTPEAKRLRASLIDYLAGPQAAGTVLMPECWLDRQFGEVKPRDMSNTVYDVPTNMTGRVLKMDIRGVAPVTGDVRVDFRQPVDGLISARGLLEGRVFKVPFTYKKGEVTHVSIPVIREDFLDGKLELEVHVMTGAAVGIERIRILPKDK